jgi:hypothetical protein
VALALDEALALRLLFDEQRAMNEARKGTVGALPPGQRYETEAEAVKGYVN